MTLAMGIRQNLGLFQAPAFKELGIAISDFALAISVQKVAWGLSQPFAAMSDFHQGIDCGVRQLGQRPFPCLGAANPTISIRTRLCQRGRRTQRHHVGTGLPQRIQHVGPSLHHCLALWQPRRVIVTCAALVLILVRQL